MWRLNYLDKKREQKYLDFLFERVKERRDSITINAVKRYLTDSRLTKLLTSKPSYLYSNIDEYQRRIFSNIEEYRNTIEAKSKKANRTPEQTILINKYESIFNVFDYKGFIVNRPDVAYAIAELIGVNACVYCNRQYIFTVNDEEDNHITRPEFDHYLPKSKYPFFALSLYNLIPSCHICNSSCKGDKIFPQEMNPYENEKQFNFSYTINEKKQPSSILLKHSEMPNTEPHEHAKQFILKIQEIYNCHTKLELNELYTFATKYSETYLQDVLSKIGSDFQISQEEAYRILFGTELLEGKTNDRPWSKFKRDILKELGVIE